MRVPVVEAGIFQASKSHIKFGEVATLHLWPPFLEFSPGFTEHYMHIKSKLKGFQPAKWTYIGGGVYEYSVLHIPKRVRDLREQSVPWDPTCKRRDSLSSYRLRQMCGHDSGGQRDMQGISVKELLCQILQVSIENVPATSKKRKLVSPKTEMVEKPPRNLFMCVANWTNQNASFDLEMFVLLQTWRGCDKEFRSEQF